MIDAATADPRLVQRLEDSEAEVARMLATPLPDSIYEEGDGYTLAGTTSFAAVRRLTLSAERFDAAAAAWEGRFRALGQPVICLVSPVTSPPDAARRLRRRGYFAARSERTWVVTEPPPSLAAPEGVLLRHGLPEDIPVLAEVVRQSWGRRPSTPWYAAIASLWPRPPGFVDYVAEAQGRVAAWVLVVRPGPEAACVLATGLPDRRSRAAALALTAWAGRDLLASGSDLIWAHIAERAPGERLGRRMGARPVYVRTPWVRVAGPWPVRTLANLTRPLRRRLQGRHRPRAMGDEARRQVNRRV